MSTTEIVRQDSRTSRTLPTSSPQLAPSKSADLVTSPTAQRIGELDALVSQAKAAAAAFAKCTQEDVDRIVKPMVLAGLEQAQYLARLAVEETKLGVLEDKVIKNMVATEFVYNYVKDKRTVGIIRAAF